MIRDEVYGYNVGDIVYISYMNDVSAGFYEVSSINPLWISDDHKGSYNSQFNNLGKIRLICKNWNRKDI